MRTNWNGVHKIGNHTSLYQKQCHGIASCTPSGWGRVGVGLPHLTASLVPFTPSFPCWPLPVLQMEDEYDFEVEIERQLAQEEEEMAEMQENIANQKLAQKTTKVKK